MRGIRRLRRVGIIGLAALLAGVLSSVGTTPAVAADPTYDIHGVTRFAGDPQAGVKVWASWADGADYRTVYTRSDTEGYYEFHGVPAGVRLFAGPTAIDDPYVDTTWPSLPARGPYSQPIPAPDEGYSYDIDLWAALSGVVTTSTDRAVRHARVCVDGTSTCDFSDHDGAFVLPTYVDRDSQIGLVVTARGYRQTHVVTQLNVVTITLTRMKVQSSKPKLLGIKKVGKTLRVKHGTWGPGSVHFSYRWYRNGHRIAGASSSSYRLTWADWRKSITVTVVGTKPGYHKAVRSSAGTGWIRWSSR